MQEFAARLVMGLFAWIAVVAVAYAVGLG